MAELNSKVEVELSVKDFAKYEEVVKENEALKETLSNQRNDRLKLKALRESQIELKKENMRQQIDIKFLLGLFKRVEDWSIYYPNSNEDLKLGNIEKKYG